MKRWSAWIWSSMVGAGLLAGCKAFPERDDCSGPDCDPTAQIQDRLCPAETHTCTLYVGGGWDSVVRWAGARKDAPQACPDAAARMSFWGEILQQDTPETDPPPDYAVGCGYAEGGTCIGVVESGEDYLCAPNIPRWPACIVANSPRTCPLDYAVQSIIGSGEATDLAWTVCCRGLELPQ